MPVKVRCPSCEKVLNAPEAARGKAVKCPECQTKVPVPAASAEAPSGPQKVVKKKPAAAKREKVAADSAEILNMDFRFAEDDRHRVCPKCGAELQEEDIECPACGVDVVTGQLSAVKKRKASQKGPDPDEFAKAAWTDSWRFMLDNKKLAIRTATYWLGLLAFAGVCGAMMIWCTRTPPKTFWGFFGFCALMAIPGWLWFLCLEVIKTSMRKKKVMDRINFDLFLNIALGLKTFAWMIVFMIPGAIAGAVLGMPLSLIWKPLQSILPVIGAYGSLLMFPVVMVHMAMPINWKAWISPLMVPIFFRTIVPSLYSCFILFCTNLLTNIISSVSGMLVGATLVAYVIAFANQPPPPDTEVHPGAIPVAVAAAVPLPPFPWVPLSVWIGSTVVVAFISSFAALFNMRVLGLFGYYFSNRLDLKTEVIQKKWESKSQPKLGKDGKPIKEDKRAKNAATSAGFIILFYVIGNFFSYMVFDVVFLPKALARALRLAEVGAAAVPPAAPGAADPAAPGQPAGPGAAGAAGAAVPAAAGAAAGVPGAAAPAAGAPPAGAPAQPAAPP